jgi:hypothetical protein
MMPGSKALRLLQLGEEATKGTAVPATTIWRGEGVLHDRREVVFPKENVGIMGGTTRSYISKQWSEIPFDSVEATFEQLPYPLEAGVAEETPTQDGTGSGYVYAYVVPETAQNVHRTYTIEGGDDQQAEEFAYAFVKHLNLAGEGQGALFMMSDWLGKSAADSTFTPALSIPSVSEIMVNSAKLYIDAIGGTIGTTEVSNTLLGLNLDHVTGLKEYWTADGSLEFSLTKWGDEEDITCMLKYEHNASAVAEKAFYRAGTPRQFRLLFEGADLATPGTYSKKTLQIDFAGVYEDWSPLGDYEGNNVVEANVRIRYDETAALKLEYLIVNELSALP